MVSFLKKEVIQVMMITSLERLPASRRIILGCKLIGDGARMKTNTKKRNSPIKQSLQAIFFSNPHKCMEHSTISDLFLFDINDLSLKLQPRLCGVNRKCSYKLLDNACVFIYRPDL